MRRRTVEKLSSLNQFGEPTRRIERNEAVVAPAVGDRNAKTRANRKFVTRRCWCGCRRGRGPYRNQAGLQSRLAVGNWPPLSEGGVDAPLEP